MNLFMEKGVVKFYSTDSKYGFIKPDDGSKDVFVHHNELQKSGIEELKKNQKVEYELNVKGKGKRHLQLTSKS